MKRYLLLIVIFSQTLYANSKLIIVKDLGGDSTAPFFESINDGGFAQSEFNQNTDTKIISANYASMLPVVSNLLVPGKVSPRAMDMPTMQPLFLIGDDELSRSWLISRSPYLKQMNAVGYIVNIKSEDALNELIEMGKGLEIVPISGDDLAKRLGLSHYPVLITATGVEQ